MKVRYLAKSAELSPCGQYRNTLFRLWGVGPTCTFIMLNPGTADGETDDAMVRRCVQFARREGCGSLVIENLFSLRATNPEELTSHRDPIGPECDAKVRHAVTKANRDATPLVAAWGANPFAVERAREVSSWGEFQCLGVTKNGAPKHPLHLAGVAALRPLTTRHVTG